MPYRLDHLLYAGSDLDALTAHFEALSGVKPGIGGVHPGMGSRNALVSLGPDAYFELIAPDPAQDIPGSFGDQFKAYASPRLFAYMVRASGLEDILEILKSEGIEADLVEASRAAPDGGMLRWRLLMPRANPFGNLLPKFIDWTDTKHPGLTTVQGCSLVDYQIGHPDAVRLKHILARLDVDLDVGIADRPCLRARLLTPNGVVILTSAD